MADGVPGISQEGAGQGASSERVNAASQRLELALRALEALTSKYGHAVKSAEQLEIQIQQLETDRARMAETIDQLSDENRTLRDANANAMKRVDQAIAAVEQVLSRQPRRSLR